jgi:UDP-glucose 6-dehydrogenase
MAKVGIFGAGWVGLVTGVCFAELGHEVVVRDVVPEKIEALQLGEIPFHERDVRELLERNRERLTFTLDAGELADCPFLFVCVDTPPTKSGDADLSRVWSVVDQLPELSGRALLVMKSTVPVGTGEKIRIGLEERGLENVGYVSNPEFLAEGTAVQDFLHPDRIAIGAFEDEDGDAVAELYSSLAAQFVRCDVNSAEMIKLTANAALMTRISFINEIANVCEAVGADVVKVAEGVGYDKRIGPHFLRAGIGYGGSCLRGGELVFLREGDGSRVTSLERLFDQWNDQGDDAEVAWPEGLEVLGWEPGAPNPSYLPVTVLTRRRFKGELLGVKHGQGQRPRVTEDHPFVVAGEPDGPTRVVLARDLTEHDWLPFVPFWKLKSVDYPKNYPLRVPALGKQSEAQVRRRGETVLVELRDILQPGDASQLPVTWHQVKALSRHSYDGHVYSLEVPGAQTFVTTAGLVVHNCFPKDSLALKQLASNSGYHFQLLAAVIEVNELQKRRVIGKLERHLGTLRGKKIALLGLAFKPNTDDMREAPSIVLAGRLVAESADVRAWDPVADGSVLPRTVEILPTIEDAVRDADAAVIVTEWAELKNLATPEIRELMANPLIIDGRNLLDPEAARAAGFTYEGVGRPTPTDVLESV